MNTQLVQQLVSSRKALKQKYRNLKSDIAKSQSSLEKSYKPITQPLQELISSLKEPKTEVKQEEPSFKLGDLYKTVQDYYRTVPEDITAGPEDVYDASQIPEESYFDDDLGRPPTSHELQMKQLEQYMSKYDTPLPREYLKHQITANDEFDFTFGVHYDVDSDKYMIGNTPIEFKGADFVIGGIIYPGTNGLYELMFKKAPLKHTHQDLDNYLDIIRRNNVHRLNYDPDGGINTSNAPKFRDIIKPNISTVNFLTKQKALDKQRHKEEMEKGIHLSPIATQRKGVNTQKMLLRPRSIPTRERSGSAPSLSSTRIGKNLDMMQLNNKKIEYRYFDDPNELVDRLRLLVASQEAGNTSHDNEIMSIIEELREAKIIA